MTNEKTNFMYLMEYLYKFPNIDTDEYRLILYILANCINNNCHTTNLTTMRNDLRMTEDFLIEKINSVDILPFFEIRINREEVVCSVFYDRDRLWENLRILKENEDSEYIKINDKRIQVTGKTKTIVDIIINTSSMDEKEVLETILSELDWGIITSPQCPPTKYLYPYKGSRWMFLIYNYESYVDIVFDPKTL